MVLGGLVLLGLTAVKENFFTKSLITVAMCSGHSQKKNFLGNGDPNVPRK